MAQIVRLDSSRWMMKSYENYKNIVNLSQIMVE